MLSFYTVAELWRYNGFQYGGRTPCWIFKILFLRPTRPIGPMCVTMPNFVPTGQTVAEIWPFINFSRWRLRFLDARNFNDSINYVGQLAKIGVYRYNRC